MTNPYLYEIIEDYKSAATKQEQDEIFRSFCALLWTNGNKRRTYSKAIRFTVRKDLLETDIGKIFDAWSAIEYTGYQAVSKETDWCSLIRQKINNLYTAYFDKKVILQRDYTSLLHTPMRLYYQWAAGAQTNADALLSAINNAMQEAKVKKEQYQKQKMDLSWNAYKKVIEGFFKKILKNCKQIDDYESCASVSFFNPYDFINEDHFYIRYFCVSLEQELAKWQKQYYGLRDHKQYQRCCLCQNLMERTGRNHKYCPVCKRQKQLEWQKAAMKKRRKTML